jgi:cytochrome b6-f complex iron-sulfur subunit
MALRGPGIGLFLPSTPLFFLLTAPSFAEGEVKGLSAVVEGIAKAGVGAFALLALFTVLVVGRFLLKTFSEWRRSSGEAAAHEPAHKVVEEGSGFAVKLAVWAAGAFAVVATLFLIASIFMMSAKAEPASASGMVSLIARVGVTAFGLVLLYTAFRSVLLLFAPKSHDDVHTAPSGEAALNPEMTRRSFLSLLGWAWVAFTAATLGALSTCLRFAFPNITFEPPSKFKVGYPEDFGIGVDNRFKDQYRVWVVRSPEGFYALTTICTHLGCTPNWLSGEDKFKCPCHGSGFYRTGINFEGPAPRPLERFKISLADDGQIEIDQSLKFQEEKGDWGKPGSFLAYKA